jgi:hypothetical protein
VTVLTNGNPVRLQQALDAGGLVVFSNFAGLINLTNTLIITTNVTLDGGPGIVQISGGGTMTNTINSAGSTNGASTSFSVPSTNGVRLFRIELGRHLTLMNLILADGRGDSGGAILNYGSLVVSNCGLAGNGAVGRPGTNGNTAGQGGASSAQPGSAGAGGRGGAICNFGTCMVFGAAFVKNSAIGGNGGNGGHGLTGGPGGDGAPGGSGGGALGGAIYSEGPISVLGCNFSQNMALAGNGGRGGNYGGGYSTPLAAGSGAPGGVARGGAIYSASRLELSQCAFIYQSALGGDGGSSGKASGYLHGPDGAEGGDGKGAGICNEGTLALWNSTFFRNKTTGGRGGAGATNVFGGFGGNGGGGGDAWAGALFHAGLASCRTTNCTFVESSVLPGGGGRAGTGPNGNGLIGSAGSSLGGNLANAGVEFVLRNTLLVSSPGGTNVSTNVIVTGVTNSAGGSAGLTLLTNLLVLTNSSSGANAYGVFAATGYDYSNDGTPLLSQTGITNGSARLGPLGFNGGPTPTLALLPGSPAIDQADPSFTLPADQRGWTRPQGGRGDIGAYEAGGIRVSGWVLEGGAGVSGVTVSANNATAITDAAGRYTIGSLAPGSCLISPRPVGAGFWPSSTNLTLVAHDLSNVVFTANAPSLRLGWTDTHPPSASLALVLVGMPLHTYRLQTTTAVATNSIWLDWAVRACDAQGFFQTTLTNTGHTRFLRAVQP